MDRNDQQYPYGGQQSVGAQYQQPYPQSTPYGDPNAGLNYVNRTTAAAAGGGTRKALIAVIIALGVILVGLIAVAAAELVHLRAGADDAVQAEITAAGAETENGGSDAENVSADAGAGEQAGSEAAEYDFSALVVDTLNEDKVFADETYNYAIPMINWEGGDVQEVNDEIFDQYDPYVENVMAISSDRIYEAESGGIWYDWFMNDGILTIIVYNYVYPDASGWDEPDIWTMDFRDPEDPVRMSSEDILACFDMTEEDLASSAQEVLGNAFCTTYEGAFDNGMDPYDSFTQGQFEKSMAESNAQNVIPFIGENGHLWIKGTVYSIAGGDSYPQLLDMEGYEISPYYTEFTGG